MDKINHSSVRLFEIGDSVFDIRYGWGKVGIICGDNHNYSIGVYGYKIKGLLYYEKTLNSNTSIHDNISLLSLTEYTLEGFTQRVINK